MPLGVARAAPRAGRASRPRPACDAPRGRAPRGRVPAASTTVAPASWQISSAAEVVPNSVRVDAAVDPGVEPAVGHPAQVERRSAQRPELPPAQRTRRHPRQPHHRPTQLDLTARHDRRAVTARSPTPHRLEAHATGQVHHHRGGRPVTVDRAQARRPPRQPARRVRGAVERVDDDHHVGVGPHQAGLLAQHADPSGVEHPVRGVVCSQVARVLAHLGAGRAPGLPRVERALHGVGGPVQQREQVGIGVRSDGPTLGRAHPWGCRTALAIAALLRGAGRGRLEAPCP